MDEDLIQMMRDELIEEVKKLRQGLRRHRDSSGHDLCWHHPSLWGLLPEKTDPVPVVPEWPEFIRGCVRYRQSLDEQAPNAPRMDEPYEKWADEAAIRELVQDWARAVRAKDVAGILANHAPDMLMFDVPPPLVSKGIDAYKKTWDLFFSWADDPVVFDFTEMHVTAGSDVAYVTALMRCSGTERNRERIRLEFRLTVGLRKIDGKWVVTHEHHSIPATQ